jgi:hypothetical protein
MMMMMINDDCGDDDDDCDDDDDSILYHCIHLYLSIHPSFSTVTGISRGKKTGICYTKGTSRSLTDLLCLLVFSIDIIVVVVVMNSDSDLYISMPIITVYIAYITIYLSIGASEIILDCCDKYLDKDGSEKELTSHVRAQLLRWA